MKKQQALLVKEGGKWRYHHQGWLRLFKMRWLDFVFLVIVLFLAWAYVHDTEQCREAYQNPCAFCTCCDVLRQAEEQQFPFYQGVEVNASFDEVEVLNIVPGGGG